MLTIAPPSLIAGRACFAHSQTDLRSTPIASSHSASVIVVVRANVLPERGAMVASLVDLESGREWLDQPAEGPDRDAGLDAVYGGREACGWDECFPTVNPVPYPEPPWEGVPLADHGELWSR